MDGLKTQNPPRQLGERRSLFVFADLLLLLGRTDVKAKIVKLWLHLCLLGMKHPSMSTHQPSVAADPH